MSSTEEKRTFTEEIIYEIWREAGINSDVVEVGLDRDGLGLIELRYKDSNGEITGRFADFPERMYKVAFKIIALYHRIKKERNLTDDQI